MCTSFTLHAKDDSYMLSRTMDFSIEMAKTVTYIPQNFPLIHDYGSNEKYQTKYAYVVKTIATSFLTGSTNKD